jgi:hypothetical protein
MPYDQILGTWDFSHLGGNNFDCDVQSFFTDQGANTAGSQKWVKPRNATMCYMIAVAGGSGGGGGRTGATTTARGGGGGGASGNIGKMLIPAIFIPDVLWVQVGNGGAGGAANSAGAIGLGTSIYYSTGLTAVTKPNLVVVSAANNQTAAGAGTAAAAGSAGTTGAPGTNATIAATAALAITSFLTGDNGVIGGAQTGAVGTDITAGWNLVALTGGAGGAGVNNVNTGFAGGNVTLQAALDFADGAESPAASIIAGGTAGGAVAAGNGNSGIQLFRPFYMTGGSGGGSSDKDVGGNGGNGGYGCGGGGGGGGTTGGTGGNGGDGFAIIISW